MEKELFYIQDLLKETNAHLKVIRRWVVVAAILFIIIPLTIIFLSIAGIFSLALLG